MKIFVFCIVYTVLTTVDCANILAVVPSPFLSHQMTYRPIWRELAKRGHKVTLITTDLMEQNENITQIDYSGFYDVFENSGLREMMVKNFSLYNVYKKAGEAAESLFEYQFGHPGLAKVLDNADNFDLLMIEMLMPKWSSIAYKMKKPFIGLTTMDAPPHIHNLLGNAIHPALYPMAELSVSYPLSFKERIISTGATIIFKVVTQYILLPIIHNYVTKYLGEDLPKGYSVDSNVSLMFINANPIFFPSRPITPMTINLEGGLHLTEKRELPKDLQTYLDESKDGFIYFSLGSTVDVNSLTPEVIEAFKKTFQALAPIRVLWKCSDETMPNKPKNVEIRKWLPQQDILRHPNIKLFITQGGLQSMEEALEYAVPMLGIAIFGDQLSNVKRIVAKNLGLSLELSSVTEQTLTDNIRELLNNPLYKNSIDKYSKIQRDRPMKALEKAIWWTEYLLRHGSTEHLKSPSANIPLYQYFFLDVIAAFIFLFSILAILSVLIMRSFIKLVRYMYRKIFSVKVGDKKVKEKEN